MRGLSIEDLLAGLDGSRELVLDKIREIFESKRREDFSPLRGLANTRDRIVQIMHNYGITGGIPTPYSPPSGRLGRNGCLNLLELMELSRRILSNSDDRDPLAHVNSCRYCRYNVVLGIYAIETVKCT